MWRLRFIVFPLIFIPLGALIVMGLWNWLAPVIFGLGAITFLQALGILILMRILLGGPRWFGRHFYWRYAWHGYGHQYGRHYDRGRWRTRMYQKWQNMTPEQREKFERFCGFNFQDVDTENEPEQKNESRGEEK